MEEGAAPLVDCHAHIFERGLPLIPTAWMEPGYDFTATDYLAMLDAHGVRYGVLSALSITGHYNDYTLAATRAHKRLRATVLAAPDMAGDHLRALAADGIVGLRLQLARAPLLPDLREGGWRATLRHVRDLDWHVHVAIEGDRLPPILAALEESGVKMVIDHFGHPTPENMANCPGLAAMLASVQRGRCWVKLSGGFRLAGPESWKDSGIALWDHADRIVPVLVDRIGADRLLWGSDAPFVGYEGRLSYADALERFRRWVPDPAMRGAISETALKFYFP